MKAGHDIPCRIWGATPLALLISILLLIFTFPSASYSGQWRVVPVWIYFDGQVKSSVITVVNESEETIHLQCKAMEWTQNQEGKDVYQETNDLIFFPRILMIKKGEQKIIRAGLRVPATSKEKTYRLFIEETPQAKTNASSGSQLTVAIRFGVAIFSKPPKEEITAEMTSETLEKGVVSAVVKNTGNMHFRINDVTVKGINGKGEETFTEKLTGWYLLAGSSRVYSTQIPPGKCAISEQLDMTATTDTNITLNRQIRVEKARCRP